MISVHVVSDLSQIVGGQCQFSAFERFTFVSLMFKIVRSEKGGRRKRSALDWLGAPVSSGY